jgi:hypothetical protein
MQVTLPQTRKFVRPQANEDWSSIATRALPETNLEEAVGSLQSWNFHVFMRPAGINGHPILPSDIIFIEPPKESRKTA